MFRVFFFFLYFLVLVVSLLVRRVVSYELDDLLKEKWFKYRYFAFFMALMVDYKLFMFWVGYLVFSWFGFSRYVGAFLSGLFVQRYEVAAVLMMGCVVENVVSFDLGNFFREFLLYSIGVLLFFYGHVFTF